MLGIRGSGGHMVCHTGFDLVGEWLMKLPAGWDIPLNIRVHIGDRPGRQREIVADGHLVLVLHKAPVAKLKHRESVYFWRPPGGDWRCSERGQPKPVLEGMIEEYDDAVDALSLTHDTAVSATQKFHVLERVGPLNRAIRNFTDTLAKAHSTIDDSDAESELQKFLDHASDVARSCELLQEDARNSLDFHIARQGELQAIHSRSVEKTTHRLNTMATVFLPLTAMASVFGMNLKSGLEQAPPWMFWAIMVGSIIAGMVVSELFAVFKLRGESRKENAGASKSGG